MELNLAEISDLHRRDDGIWRSRGRGKVGEISYPDEGNCNCLGVEEGSFWFSHRNRCIAATVGNFPPAGAIFDIGGGNGFVARGLADAGFEVVLVEPGEEGARNALQRGVDHVVCATLEDAKFRDASLPAASLFDVLEHVEDDTAFLKQLRAKLAPGGRLYISVPAYRLLWSVEDDYAGHYRRYRMAELGRVLGAAGFRVDFATYIFSFLPLPIFVMRSLPSRLGMVGEHDMRRTGREHLRQAGIGTKLVDRLCRWELARVRRARKLAFGGSCLVVASSDG
jgi:SAM-dependent methyltransferase